MADLGLLGLYALSRSIAGNKQREREKEAMKPVTYVRVGNDTVQFDKDNPDHKNAPVIGVKIGNNFISEPERFTPAVKTPSGEIVTVDEYRGRALENIEKAATSRDFGASLSTDPEKIPEMLGPKIVIPPVIGNISSRGGFKPIQTGTASKSAVVGGYGADGKFTGWMSLTDYSVKYPNQQPTLQAMQENNNISNLDKFKGLPDSSKQKAKNVKGITSPVLTRILKNTNGPDQVEKYTIGSANTTVFGQLSDMHAKFTKYSHEFVGKKTNDPQVVKMRNFLVGLMVKDSIIDPVEGTDPSLAMSINYQDGVAYLKKFPEFKKIPGMIPALQFAQNRISEDTLGKALQNTDSPLNENTSLPGQAKVGDNVFNFTVTFPHTLTKKNDLKDTAMFIANDRVPQGSTEAQKNAAVEPLIEYVRKVDNMGNTRGVMKGEDGKKIPKPANQQHKLIFYNTLRTTPAAIGKGSLYPVFKKVVAPRMFRAKFGDVKTSVNDEQDIKNIYATDIASLPNGYQIGHRIIMNNQEGEVTNDDNTTLEKKIYDQFKQNQFVTTKTIQDFYADATNKKLYSATTISLLKRYKATYFNLDGTPNNISTAVGNVIMMKDGILYWYDTIKNAFGNLLPDSKRDDVFAPIKGMKDLRGGELTEQGMLESISETFYKRGKFGRNDTMNAQRQSEMRNIARGMKSSEATTRALAQRAYYRMMIAYQMAAAIQGGTGGRTISDQDVDNILKALGGAGLTASPEKEIAGIDAAMTLMQDIYQFNKHMSGTRAERNAALKHQEFITEGNPNGVMRSPMGITGAEVAVFIANSRGTTMNFGTGGKTPDTTSDITDADVLQSYNARQDLLGAKPFKTVEEMKNAFEKEGKNFDAEKRKIIKMSPR